MNGPVRCFALTVGKLEIAMPTRDIAVLRPGAGKPGAGFSWLETTADGKLRLTFDLSRIFFPGEPSRPTRAVVLVPQSVPDGLRRSFEKRREGEAFECAFLCERIDREIDIPAALLRPLPQLIRPEGIFGAFSRLAFIDGAAYPLMQAKELIDTLVRFRRSLQ